MNKTLKIGLFYNIIIKQYYNKLINDILVRLLMLNIVKPLLYSPAGDIQKAISALFFGADGIYIGLNKFGLRRSGKVNEIELKDLIDFCHKESKKIDITLNAYIRDDEIEDIRNYLEKIFELNPDSIIISDPAIIQICSEFFSDLYKSEKLNDNNDLKIPYLTLSTQANTTNFYAMKFWNKNGIKRIVAARELSLFEIFQIKQRHEKENLSFELEVFIHGAMCISLSGRCLLSLYMTNKKLSNKGSDYLRDANRGECVHPCRFAYLVEQSRPNEYFPIEEDGKYTYILSSKDLCLIYYIPLFMYAGVNAFKIEGRMKSSFYTSTITYAYRLAIDKACQIFNDIEISHEDLINFFNNPSSFLHQFPEWKEFVDSISVYTDLASHRPYTTGFYFKMEHPDYMMPLYDNKIIQKYLIVAESILQSKFSEFNEKSDELKGIKLHENQFFIYAKNSVSLNGLTLYLFSIKGINIIQEYNIFDLFMNKTDLIKHSNYYILELKENFVSKISLSKDDIFFIYKNN